MSEKPKGWTKEQLESQLDGVMDAIECIINSENMSPLDTFYRLSEIVDSRNNMPETAHMAQRLQEKGSVIKILNKSVAELKSAAKDALSRLQEYSETDCECDNTHDQHGTVCHLCGLSDALRGAIINAERIES